MISQSAALTREEILETIINSTHYWEEWIGPDGEFIYISPACERVSGYSAQEFISDPSLRDAIIYPDDRQIYQEHSRQTMDNGQPGQEFQYRMVHRNGEIHWVSQHGRALLAEDGSLRGYRNSLHDITKSKQIEQTLRHYKAQVSQLINAPSDMIVLIDPNGVILFTNETFAAATNQPPAALVGKSFWDYLPPEDADIRKNEVAEVLQSGQPLQLEARGRLGNYDTLIHPIKDEHNLVSSVAIHGRYIQEQRRVAQDDLSHSIKTIETMIESPNDSVMLVDANGEILFANTAVAQVLSTTVDALVGTNLWSLFSPEKRANRKRIIQQVIETGKPHRMENSGKYGTFDSSIYPIYDRQGVVSKVAILARDITEHKKAEQVLQESIDHIMSLINVRTDIALLTDTKGNILFANEAMGRALNRKSEELPGQELWQFFTPEIREFRQGIYKEVISTGEMVRVEDRTTVRPDLTINYDSITYPIHNQEGQVVQIAVLARDITERKQMEQQLRESEALYRTLIETSPDAIVLTDLQGGFVTVNKQFLNLFGYESLAEIQAAGLTGFDLLQDYDLQRGIQNVNLTKEMGVFQGPEYSVRCKDGTIIQVAANGALITDSQGNPSGFMAVVRDITEQKKIEQQLRESEKLYRTLVETSPDAIVQIDLLGNLVTANQQFLRLFGYENLAEIQAAGLTGFDLISDNDLARGLEKVSMTRDKGFSDGGEYEVHRKDGAIIQVAANGALITDSTGEPSGLMSVVRDITKRKQMEQQLRESELLYRTLVETSPDAIIMTDFNGDIIAANRHFFELYGYKDMDDFRASGLTGVDLVDEADRAKAFEGIAYTLEHEVSHGFEYKTRRKDGSTFPVSAKAAIIRDIDGAPTSLITIARDISDWKKAQEELRHSNEQLEVILNGVAAGVHVWDQDNKLVYANQGNTWMHEIFTSQDYQAHAEIVEQFLIMDINGEPLPIDQRPGHLARQGIQSPPNQIRIRHLPSGEEKWNIINATPILDDEGQVRLTIVITDDITQLKEADDKIRRSRDQLAVILEGITDGIYVLDPHGNITFANQAAIRQLSFDPTEEKSDPIPSITELEFIDTNGRLLPIDQLPGWQALEGQKVPPTMLKIQSKDHADDKWLLVGAEPIFSEQGALQMVVVISHDFTEIRLAQKKLEQAHRQLEVRVEERTAELAQANQDLIKEIAERRRAAARSEALAQVAARINAQLDLQTVLDTVCEQTARAVNMPACSILLHETISDTLQVTAAFGPFDGKYAQKVPPIPLALFQNIEPDSNNIVIIEDTSALQNLLVEDLTTEASIRTIAYTTLENDGHFIGALMVVSVGEVRVPGDDELEMLRALANQAAVAITNANLFEQVSDGRKRLQTLSQRLMEVQEKERQHLARELHDEIGQTLTYLNLVLDTLSESLKTGSFSSLQAKIDLARAHKLVEQILNRVREISLNLRPGMLDDLGLLPALLSYFERYSEQTKTQVDFKHSGMDRRFSSQIETTAYRVIQEALTNVARHADTDQVSVRLWLQDQSLGLQVKDLGAGFNLKKVRSKKGSSGLTGISERINLCSGQIEVESQPGHGTCITAELPVVE